MWSIKGTKWSLTWAGVSFNGKSSKKGSLGEEQGQLVGLLCVIFRHTGGAIEGFQVACHFNFFLKGTDWEGRWLEFGGWLLEGGREGGREKGVGREHGCPGNHWRLLRGGAV